MNTNITSITHKGLVRDNNEDAVAACCNLNIQQWDATDEVDAYQPLSPLGSLVVVADGMGGALAGEVASQIALDTLRERFADAEILNSQAVQDPAAFLTDSITEAHRRIVEHADLHPESIGLGTTIVVLWLKDETAHIAWCGDSRLYVFNPSTGLRRLTKDHSYVQELVDNGKIAPDEAFGHPESNVITRCLGDAENSDCIPDTMTYDTTPGDIFLLCSDGLCGYCHDTKIEQIMVDNYKHLKQCRDRLLNLALKAGGYDNITIALCATLPDGQTLPHLSFWEKMTQRFA